MVAQQLNTVVVLMAFKGNEIYFPEQDIFIATLYNSLNEGGSDAGFMALDNDIATLSLDKTAGSRYPC
jgi:hypothetical protein